MRRNLESPSSNDLPSQASVPLSQVPPSFSTANIAESIGVAVTGARQLSSRIAELTGVDQAPERIGESVQRIRVFVDQKLDSILGGIAAASHRASEIGIVGLRRAEEDIQQRLERMIGTSLVVIGRVASIPEEAKGILMDAERLKDVAQDRARSMRQWSRRLKAKRGATQAKLTKRLHDVYLEVESEFEEEAWKAEEIGEAATRRSQEVFQETVANAQRLSDRLIGDVAARVQRGRALGENVRSELRSANAWAQRHLAQASAFKSQRVQAASGISGLGSAKEWAEITLVGAQRLAEEVAVDAANQTEAMQRTGRQAVLEAMNLAKSAAGDMASAGQWVRRQTSGDLGFKRKASAIHRSAKDQLDAQRDRILAGLRLPEQEPIMEEMPRVMDDERFVIHQEARAILHEDLGEPPSSPPEDDPEFSLPTLGRDPPANDERLDIELPGFRESGESVAQQILPPEPRLRKSRKRNPDRHPPPQTRRLEPEFEKPAKVQETKPRPVIKPNVKQETPNVEHGEIRPPPSKPTPVPHLKPETQNTSIEIPISGTAPKVDAPKPPIEMPAKTKPPPSTAPTTKTPGKSNPKKLPVPLPNRTPRPKTEKASAVGESGPPPVSAPQVTPVAPVAKSPGSPNRTAKGMNKAPPPGIQAPSLSGEKPMDAAKQETSAPSPPDNPKEFHQQLLSADGPGAPPHPAVKDRLAGYMGFDISQARLHTSPTAATAAQMVSADAFTIGRDVFFGANKYDPTSPKGLGLIAHEITHVGQQLGLQGDKMRFATKSGGDDMEQEAIEIGERVANNLVHPNGVKVGSYIRNYTPADDQPLNAGVQTRLDRLGLRALSKASRQLAATLTGKNIRLDEVAIDLTIDLDSQTDEEAVDQWAEAIYAAVESAMLTTHSGVVPATASLSDGPAVQMRLGDDSQLAKLSNSDQAEAEIAAKLAKISASPDDKDLIRKLYVRKELDTQIKKAKKKRGGFSLADFSAFSGVSVAKIKDAFPLKFGDEEMFVNSKLAKYGISSGTEYESLEAQLLSMFVAKGIEATLFMLDENERIAQKEYTRYYTTGTYGGPSADVFELKKAAKEIFLLQYNFVETYNYVAKKENLLNRHKSYKPRLPMATMKDMPILNRVLRPTLLPEERIAMLTPMWQDWQTTRAELGAKFPLLLGNMDLLSIASSDSNPDLIHNIVMHVGSILDDIKETKERLSEKKFWELSKMVELTKKNLGVRPKEGADLVIAEYMEKKSDDETLWNLLKAAAAIALAVTAMVATGGLAAVAMVGSAALSTYNFAENLDSYTFKSAATNTSVDKAKLISTDNPSMFWLALDLIGAGLDIGAAASAFKNLSKVVKAAEEARTAAKAIRADSQAIEDLDAAARKVYRQNPDLKLTEDEFVARLFESARRGLKSAEHANAQLKVVTELLEGTSKRVIRILAGDEKAVLSMVKEHGNWRGLMNGLMQGGEDGQKLAGEFSKVREALVNDLHVQGFQRLDSASVGALSDYDLSVKVLDGETMGAGAKLIAKENEMALKYGDNWKEAFDINFYTEGRQLLAVDEALKLTTLAADKAGRYRRITQLAEELNFAKMVEHAGDDLDAIRRIEGYLKSSGAKYDIPHLKKVGEDLRAVGRDQILLDIDEHMAHLKTVKKAEARAALNEEISRLQMQANYLMNEAYIGPASIKGGHFTAAEAHQVAMSQLEMIEHTIRNNGGDVLKTVRNYEFHKYVNRYVQAAKDAGLSSDALNEFETLSRYIYKNVENRSMLNFTGQYGRNLPPTDLVDGVIDATYIQKQFDNFMNEVHNTLPKIRKAAIDNPGFSPRAPKPPPNPPPAPKPPPATPPPPPPAAAAASAPTHTVTDVLDDANRLSSTGFAGSGQGANVGVYKTSIPGVSQPVIVKTFRPGQASRMEAELAAAIAAERTGVGPKVYGKIVYDSPTGGKRIGFAMDEVKGGFADAFAGAADAGWTTHRLEMLRNAENITPGTLQDLEKFRQGMLDQGFYYKGDLQGFVDSKGNWRAIDVQGASPISEAGSLDEALVQHKKVFDDMRDLLERRAKEAKEARAKGIL